MKTAIITGVSGQDGSFLANFLLEKGYNVIGITNQLKETSKNGLKNLKYLGIDKKIGLVAVNLLDTSSIIRIIEEYEPAEIYNLAAQSSVGVSFEQPIRTLEFNVMSTLNLLEAIRTTNPKVRFYQASSSEMFGKVQKENLPLKENYFFHPLSPYGISKAAAHWITVNYREAYGVLSACGICFNHESSLRGRNFVTKKIVNVSVKIKMGLADSLTLGNLKVYRDWGYAPAYVQAMWMMLNQHIPEDYILCSGEVHSLEEFVFGVFKKLDLDPEKYLKVDESLYRPVELEMIYGDNSKAKEKLGWNYNISFDQLINKLIEDEVQYMRWELSHEQG